MHTDNTYVKIDLDAIADNFDAVRQKEALFPARTSLLQFAQAGHRRVMNA